MADPGSQMAEAVAGMRRHAAAAASIDRRDWTTEQWAADARRLMDDIDGSICSLVNGHVSALLRLADRLDKIRAFHEEWGGTDGDNLDQLALWEDLGYILAGGGS